MCGSCLRVFFNYLLLLSSFVSHLIERQIIDLQNKINTQDLAFPDGGILVSDFRRPPGASLRVACSHYQDKTHSLPG